MILTWVICWYFTRKFRCNRSKLTVKTFLPLKTSKSYLSIKDSERSISTVLILKYGDPNRVSSALWVAKTAAAMTRIQTMVYRKNRVLNNAQREPPALDNVLDLLLFPICESRQPQAQLVEIDADGLGGFR